MVVSEVARSGCHSMIVCAVMIRHDVTCGDREMSFVVSEDVVGTL